MTLPIGGRSFGINLEKARKRKKLSRWKLASMVGISWRKLYRLEKGIDREIEIRVMTDLMNIIQKEMQEIIQEQSSNRDISQEDEI